MGLLGGCRGEGEGAGTGICTGTDVGCRPAITEPLLGNGVSVDSDPSFGSLLFFSFFSRSWLFVLRSRVLLCLRSCRLCQSITKLNSNQKCDDKHTLAG